MKYYEKGTDRIIIQNSKNPNIHYVGFIGYGRYTASTKDELINKMHNEIYWNFKTLMNKGRKDFLGRYVPLTEEEKKESIKWHIETEEEAIKTIIEVETR